MFHLQLFSEQAIDFTECEVLAASGGETDFYTWWDLVLSTKPVQPGQKAIGSLSGRDRPTFTVFIIRLQLLIV